MFRKLFVLTLLAATGCTKAAPPTPDAKPAEAPPLHCNTIDPSSCDVEGLKYENAVGRPVNLNAAARHYAAACEAGFGPGCTHLADMYFAKEAFDNATALYQKGCDAGDAEGCANLGFMESRAGHGDQARELYTQACDGGSMTACANLADIEQAGRGVSVDHDKARELFARSCAGGNASACIRRAWSIAQGCKGSKCATPATDEKGAAQLTKTSCASTKDPVVCTGYAVHLESGRLLPKDEKAARALYQTGCDAGSPWACERLGVAMSRGLGGPQDAAGAVAALEKSCDADFASACSGLGAMLLGGTGVTRDAKRGAELVHRACDLHEARACNTARLLGL